MVYQFVTAPPVSQYFSDLILSIKKQCLHLDALVNVTEYGISIQKIVILVSPYMLVIPSACWFTKPVDFGAVSFAPGEGQENFFSELIKLWTISTILRMYFLFMNHV